MKRPIAEAHRLPMKCKAHVSARVSHLICATSPHAIVGRISTFIIKSLNLKSIGSRSHVYEKVCKCIPSLADRDASASVIPEMFVAWIHTALSHLRPDHVLAGAFSITRRAVFGYSFQPKAATTRCVGSRQVSSQDECFIATDAAAFPDNGSSRCGSMRWNNNRESSKHPSCQIELSARDVNIGRAVYSWISHAVSSLGDGVVRGCESLVTTLSLAFNYLTLPLFNECAA